MNRARHILSRHSFIGKEEDRTKEHDFGPRYYSADLGRFLAPDPILSGASPYAYAGGNPVMYYDPTGLSEEAWWTAAPAALTPWELRQVDWGSTMAQDALFRAEERQNAADAMYKGDVIARVSGSGYAWGGPTEKAQKMKDQIAKAEREHAARQMQKVVEKMTENAIFLLNFLFGTGPDELIYLPGDPRLEEFKNSPGVNRLRDLFAERCYENIDDGSYSTEMAFLETIALPFMVGAAAHIPGLLAAATFVGTQMASQVGGFAAAHVYNNGNGTATFIISNEAGMHSFFYHLVSNKPSPRGPGRTIRQTFMWIEMIP